jgi:inhibitor of growth protein 4
VDKKAEAAQALLAPIDGHEQECMNVADEKIALVNQAYDLIDAHIVALDKDLKRFEADLREDRLNVGRLVGAKLPGGGPTLVGKRSHQEHELLPGNINPLTGKRKYVRRADREREAASEAVGSDGEEMVYCSCKQVSFGKMIACDGQNCQIEWFHLSCMGMTEPPKGKWYCPDCRRSATVSSQPKIQ